MMTIAAGLFYNGERLVILEGWLEMAPEYICWTRFWDEICYKIEGVRVIPMAEAYVSEDLLFGALLSLSAVYIRASK